MSYSGVKDNQRLLSFPGLTDVYPAIDHLLCTTRKQLACKLSLLFQNHMRILRNYLSVSETANYH